MRLPYVLGSAFTLAASLVALAQNAPQTNPYPTSLYQMNDVSKTLNLTQDQINKLNALTEQVQAQYRQNYARLNTLNEQERFARQQELNRQYYNDWNKGATDIFNANQRTRYQQVNYQYGGFNTLYDPDVQKRLNLTPAQVESLRENAVWSNQQLQDISRLGATDAAKATQMYRDYWTQRQERFNKFLTPEQQRTWGQMIGEPYTFQPTFVR